MAHRPVLTALTAVCLTASVIVVIPAESVAAAPPAPAILNDGTQNSGDAQWMETQSLPDAASKVFVATFLVQHAPGRSITSVKLDADFDGTDETASSSHISVTSQTYGFGGASAIETSRVTVSVQIGTPTGLSCPFVGGAVRAIDGPVRMRVVDNSGEQSASVSTTVRFVDADNCVGAQDFPRLTSTSQNLTTARPGQSVTYTFTCADADVDVFSSDDDCDRANIRWRRLDTGETSAVVLKTGMDDDATQSHSMSFPSRGYYVVEAQLGNENGSFPNTGGSPGGWWRLGNAAINDSSLSLSGALTYSGANASDPPSVNEGSTVAAVASVADEGGVIQIIEWDANNDGTFERREYSVPVNSAGDIAHPNLTSAELTQAVSTDTPGLITTRARVTDNGALDAADLTREQRTISGQLRINARPTASGVTTQTDEDTPVTVTLAGADTDAQPAPLSYEIVTGPAEGTGTLGPVTGNQVEFTPAADFSGSTSFTYRASDGGPATIAAWASSEVATVSITVNPSNDAPVAGDQSVSLPEDATSFPVTLTATDVDDTELVFTGAAGVTHGTLSCVDQSCTYTPDANYNGPDSFTFSVSDGELSDVGEVTINVTAVNDPPVATDRTLTLAMQSTATFTLEGSDVDGDALTFTAPVQGPSRGTLACTGATCQYTPNRGFHGSDAFTFRVDDGNGGTDVGTVAITVTPGRKPPGRP